MLAGRPELKRLPEKVQGMSKEQAYEQMAEMGIPSEEEEYGDILRTDRESIKDSLIRDLDEVHSQGGEDPRIRLARILEAAI